MSFLLAIIANKQKTRLVVQNYQHNNLLDVKLNRDLKAALISKGTKDCFKSSSFCGCMLGFDDF